MPFSIHTTFKLCHISEHKKSPEKALLKRFSGLKTLVPLTRLELVRYCYQGILSPSCLPIPPQRRFILFLTDIIIQHFL